MIRLTPADRSMLRDTWRRCALIPSQGLQVVAYELLVEARRTAADDILRRRPETRRIRGQDLADEEEFGGVTPVLVPMAEQRRCADGRPHRRSGKVVRREHRSKVVYLSFERRPNCQPEYSSPGPERVMTVDSHPHIRVPVNALSSVNFGVTTTYTQLLRADMQPVSLRKNPWAS